MRVGRSKGIKIVRGSALQWGLRTQHQQKIAGMTQTVSNDWDPGSQSAHLSVCDSNGHLIVVAWPDSMPAGPLCADVSVTDTQPLPMDSDSPMVSVGSSVNLHAESLQHSTDHAPVTLLSCSTAGQGCRTADAQPQHPLPLSQCLPTNLMFASLQCATPELNASCNNQSDGVSQSQHHGPAGKINNSTSHAQFKHSQFHLSEATAVKIIQCRAARIHVHLSDDAAQAANCMLVTLLPQQMHQQHVAQVQGSGKLLTS